MPLDRDYYINLARTYATEAGIDPDIFVAQINQESGFQTGLTSYAGATGIAQIIPSIHTTVDANDPDASLRYAANLIAGHLSNYGGDIRKALTAYHAGPGILNRAIEIGGANWEGSIAAAALDFFPNEAERIGRDNVTYLTSILGGNPIIPEDPGPRAPISAAGDDAATFAEAFTFEYRKRLSEIARDMFGKLPDETPQEPFPGFSELVSQFERADRLNQSRLEAISEELSTLKPPSELPIESLIGMLPPGYIRPVGEFLFTAGTIGRGLFGGGNIDEQREEYDKQVEALRAERDVLFGNTNDIARFFTAVELQVVTLQDRDPEVRSEAQSELDQLTDKNSSTQEKMIGPALELIRSSMEEQINLLSTMTPEEIGVISQVPITDKLFDRRRARPIASYLLSTDQLRLSLKGFRPQGPAELQTGEDIRNVLMAQGLDSEEARAYREDTLARVRDRLDAYADLEAQIEALRTGQGDWSLPKPGTAAYLKTMAIQPILVAAGALDTYFKTVVRPIAGQALYYPALLVPGEQKIERDMDLALEDSNFWSAAGHAWEANTWHPVAKFAVETIADPTTYIGWGIATKLVKPIPILGRPLSRMVAAAEFGYLEVASAPFKIVGGGIRALIPRPASTLGLLAGEDVTGKLIQLVTRANKDTPYIELTAEQVTSTLSNALKRGYQFPEGIGLADLGVQISQVLRAQAVPDIDTVLTWSAKAGGSLTRESLIRSKTVLLSIENILVEAADKPDRVGIMARQLMTVFGVVDTADSKGFKLVKSLVDNFVTAGDRQAELLIQGDSVGAIISKIAQSTEALTIANHESLAAKSAERLGILSLPLQKVPEGIGAIWSGTVEKFLIRPLARSYLLFGMYHLWNVAETKGKALLAGINPFYRGNRSNMILNSWADSLGTRSEVLLGGGRGLMWGESYNTVQAARKGIDKFLAPKALSKLFREELAIKIQAADQVLIQHQLALRELKRKLPEVWTEIETAMKESGMDFKFLPKDLRPWAQDATEAAILRDPNAVRALPGEATAERLREFNIQNMLSQYEHLDSHVQDFIMTQARSGRLFKETEKVGEEVLDLIWESHLRSPELFALNYEEMAEEILTAPINTWEDFSNRLMTLQGMSRGYGGVLEHQYGIAREASERVVNASDNDAIWSLWRDSSDQFGTRAGESLDQYITSLRTHMGAVGDKSSDVELLMSRYKALKDLESSAYARRGQIAEGIFGKSAPKGARPKTHNDWLKAKEQMGQPFRDITTTKEALTREIYTLEARIGNQAKNPLPDVAGRPISRVDIATIYNMRPDDVSSMTMLVDLQAMMGRNEFVQEVTLRAGLNKEAGQDLAQLGWTKEAIGEVWDDIMKEFRLNPDNVSRIAPTLMQVEDMVRGVRLEVTKETLDTRARSEFQQWADGLAGKLERVGGYASTPPLIIENVAPEARVAIDDLMRKLPIKLQEAIKNKVTSVRVVDSIDSVGTLAILDNKTGEISVLGSALGKHDDDVLLHELLHAAIQDMDDPTLFKAFQVSIGEGGKDISPQIVEEDLIRSLTPYYGGRIAEGISGPSNLPDDVVRLFDERFGRVSSGRTTESWLTSKGEALESATTEFYRIFPDYVDLNYLDKFFRSQFPFWVYEWHRLWYLPRQFMRTPGLATGLGRYNEATGGDNYLHVPGTSLEINPLRGTILMGGLRRLMLRDYPEFYDTFPKAQQVLDSIGRFGFYPGAHVTIGNLLFGTGSGPQFNQIGEIVPVWMKAPVQGFLAFAELTGNDTMKEASKRLANVFIPERFRDYMISMKVSEIGAKDPDTGKMVTGADISNKRLAGTQLTPFEQELWDRATGELAPWMILMDQTGLFRFRPEELTEARKEYDIIVSEYTGFSLEQLKDMRNWGIRWQDIVPPSPEMRDLLSSTESLERWSGFTSVLFNVSEQNFRARRNEFWDEVDVLRLDITSQQEELDCRFGFVGATSCDHPGSIDARSWKSLHGELGAAYGTGFDNLRGLDRYKDIPVTNEEILEFYQRTGQPLPTEHPMTELLRMYYDIELKEVFDPETGTIGPDYDTFYMQREILLQATDERRDEMEDRISKYDSDLEKLHRWSYIQYLRPYYNRRDLTIERFSDEEQTVIRQWLSSGNVLEREALADLQSNGRSIIRQYQDDIKLAGKNLRFYSPDIDAWLAFWQVTTSFRTDEGQRRYEVLMAQYRPGEYQSPPVDDPETPVMVSNEGGTGA